MKNLIRPILIWTISINCFANDFLRQECLDQIAGLREVYKSQHRRAVRYEFLAKRLEGQVQELVERNAQRRPGESFNLNMRKLNICEMYYYSESGYPPFIQVKRTHVTRHKEEGCGRGEIHYTLGGKALLPKRRFSPFSYEEENARAIREEGSEQFLIEQCAFVTDLFGDEKQVMTGDFPRYKICASYDSSTDKISLRGEGFSQELNEFISLYSPGIEEGLPEIIDMPYCREVLAESEVADHSRSEDSVASSDSSLDVSSSMIRE